MQNLFSAWRITILEQNLIGFMAETESLKAKLGKKSESIWHMNRADLVEVARKELGMTLAAAEKETVVTLREKIRRQRDVSKVMLDPMSQVPKGLDRMKLEELKSECLLRGLPELPKPTRPALIVQIRDDVEQRTLLSAQTASASATSVPEDEDEWDLLHGPRGQAKARSR